MSKLELMQQNASRSRGETQSKRSSEISKDNSASQTKFVFIYYYQYMVKGPRNTYTYVAMTQVCGNTNVPI